MINLITTAIVFSSGKYPRMLGIEPVAAWWEASMLPLCSAAPHPCTAHLRNVTLISKALSPVQVQSLRVQSGRFESRSCRLGSNVAPNVSRFRFPVDRDPPTHPPEFFFYFFFGVNRLFCVRNASKSVKRLDLNPPIVSASKKWWVLEKKNYFERFLIRAFCRNRGGSKRMKNTFFLTLKYTDLS